jgi:hypothetical protein
LNGSQGDLVRPTICFPMSNWDALHFFVCKSYVQLALILIPIR